MLKTLRESKAKLSELVRRASNGEDTLITVRGSVKARLTRADVPKAARLGEAWAKELRTLQGSMVARPKPRMTIARILAEEREDRV
jgi:prevent-host-death family protein